MGNQGMGRWYIAAAVTASLLCSAKVGLAADDVTLTVAHAADGYLVHGTFLTAAPRSIVWSVLTDYNGLDHFVSSMRTSRVLRRTRDSLIVEQAAVCRVLLFSRTIHLLLQVHEQPFDAIHFVDLSHRDLRAYSGEWQLYGEPGAIRVEYRVRAADPGGMNFLAERAIRGASRGLLREVRDEIEKRALHDGTTPAAPASAAR